MNYNIVSKLLNGIECAWGEGFAPLIDNDPTISPEEVTIEVSSAECLAVHPLVTVYMLAYNHGKYIRKAIEGVMMQQTDFPFELIIGEDCSPDNTRDICIELQKKYPERIRVLYSKKNLGGTKNFRRIRDYVRGDYVAICEGDDYWSSPNKLKKQIDIFRNAPDTSICYTDFSEYDEVTAKSNHNVLEKLGIFDKWDTLSQDDFLTESFLGYNFWATASIMVERKKWEDFYKNYPLGTRKFLLGDIVLRTEMAKRGRVQCVQEDMVTYRHNSTGITEAKRELGSKFHLHNLYLKIYCISTVPEELFWNTIDFTARSNTYYFTLNTERRDAWRKSLRVIANECPFKDIRRRMKLLSMLCLLPKGLSNLMFRFYRKIWK